MGPKTNKHAQEARERESSKKEAQQVLPHASHNPFLLPHASHNPFLASNYISNLCNDTGARQFLTDCSLKAAAAKAAEDARWAETDPKVTAPCGYVLL